jgi:hypothetical protein
MKTIKIYTVIPYFDNGVDVFLNDVKSFTSYDKASYYMNDIKRQFGFRYCDITESELDVDLENI